jgi:flavodoxin I
MKILVTYYTQTGNTEQIAKAIHQELSGRHDAELKKVEEIKLDAVQGYDILFVGSPIHANGLAAPVKEFLEAVPEGAGFKLAGFVTHASFAYEKAGFEMGIQSFDDISKQKHIDLLGCFDCEGRLAKELQPMIKQVREASDEEWAERMAELDQHPNADDEQKAKAFTRDVLSRA